jgi:DNA-directed RNA polymerase specialized sigma24 family protein
MGQDKSDRAERPGPAPEPFDDFYLREYPAVVGLLQGLLRSRLVAEELAQETFLVAYRDWGESAASTTRAPGSARWP